MTSRIATRAAEQLAGSVDGYADDRERSDRERSRHGSWSVLCHEQRTSCEWSAVAGLGVGGRTYPGTAVRSARRRSTRASRHSAAPTDTATTALARAMSTCCVLGG